MCSPFSCSSFKSWKEYYDIDELPTPIKNPKKSKSLRSYSSSSKRRDRDSKQNPYANQGLDKFAALLAELEAKKQKIYTQKGSSDISYIYFSYTKSDDEELQPFVVKAKKLPPQHTIKITTTTKNNVVGNKEKELMIKRVSDVVINKDSIIKASAARATSVDHEAARQQKKNKPSQIRKTFWSFKLKNDRDERRRIFSYLPVTIVLILLLLALSGRSFAILCVTVAWYLVPTLSRKIAPPVDHPKTIDRRK